MDMIAEVRAAIAEARGNGLRKSGAGWLGPRPALLSAAAEKARPSGDKPGRRVIACWIFFRLRPGTAKPRQTGLTHVLDKGLGLRQVEDLLETAGEFIDIVKLGWGTGYVTGRLADKIAAYRTAGIPVCFGGTLLEAAIAQGRFDEFRRTVRRLGLSHAEFSTGVLDMDLEKKIEYVRALAEDFVVLAEVGSKDAEAEVVPERWIEEIEGVASGRRLEGHRRSPRERHRGPFPRHGQSPGLASWT